MSTASSRTVAFFREYTLGLSVLPRRIVTGIGEIERAIRRINQVLRIVERFALVLGRQCRALSILFPVALSRHRCARHRLPKQFCPGCRRSMPTAMVSARVGRHQTAAWIPLVDLPGTQGGVDEITTLAHPHGDHREYPVRALLAHCPPVSRSWHPVARSNRKRNQTRTASSPQWSERSCAQATPPPAAILRTACSSLDPPVGSRHQSSAWIRTRVPIW